MTSAGDKPSLELDLRAAKVIYDQIVLPLYGINALPAKEPVFTIVGGQQGSGKTTVLEKLNSNRPNGEAVQRITVDNLMPLVPGYTQAAARDSLTAQGAVGDTAGQWGWQLMERALSNRNHIALELAHGGQISEIAALAKSYGYKTELVVLAVHKDHSWNSVVTRYERDLNTGNKDARFISRSGHQNAYDGWPVGLQKAEVNKAFDSILVVGRDGTVFVKNELVPGKGMEQDWATKPQGMETLMVQRHRPWTNEQRQASIQTWDTNVKSAALARALPDQMAEFAIDRAGNIAYAKSDASRYNVFAPDPNISQSGISLWVKRFTQDVGAMVGKLTPETQSADMRERLGILTKTIRSITQASHARSSTAQIPPVAKADSNQNQNTVTSNEATAARPAVSQFPPVQSRGRTR